MIPDGYVCTLSALAVHDALHQPEMRVRIFDDILFLSTITCSLVCAVQYRCAQLDIHHLHILATLIEIISGQQHLLAREDFLLRVADGHNVVGTCECIYDDAFAVRESWVGEKLTLSIAAIAVGEIWLGCKVNGHAR